jgi:hypothetical protein
MDTDQEKVDYVFKRMSHKAGRQLETTELLSPKLLCSLVGVLTSEPANILNCSGEEIIDLSAEIMIMQNTHVALIFQKVWNTQDYSIFKQKGKRR